MIGHNVRYVIIFRRKYCQNDYHFDYQNDRGYFLKSLKINCLLRGRDVLYLKKSTCGGFMEILVIFAFLAGIVTVLSPCVLPVLPALLSAGGGKGHLRPLGIICGLIFSFTFFTLALTTIVHLTGISPDFLRYIAIGLIALFDLFMIFPSLGDKFAEATSGIADLGQSVQEKSKLFGSGFWSGFILGIALGLVWTPCAGPILAAITTLVATGAVTWFTFLITLAYSLGAAIPMFLIIYGGKRIVNSSRGLSKYTEWIRKGFGVLMILGAFAIAFHYDVKFQQFAIQYVPLINIENNSVVRKELEKLRDSDSSNKAFVLPSEEPIANTKVALPKIAPAPELIGITGWINTDPFTLQQLHGKVVLIDFWTYSCINCIRTFPYLKDWYAKYEDKGFVIVGVHTPEFEFEKNINNIKDAVQRFGLKYPVAVDSNFQTWQNFNNHFWPAHSLVDQEGIVRSFHFGEGAYKETENDIRTLLGLPKLDVKKEIVASHRPITPETYLGSERADRYVSENKITPEANVSYTYAESLKNDQIGLRGDWLVSPEKITSMGEVGDLDLNFLATRVYLVMDSETPQLVTVYLDGHPLAKEYYTEDMNENGQILVKEPRKYDVLNLKGHYGRHLLTLKTPKGVSLYAFTFGDES